ncbi:MAG: aminotransferase class V-fold PLP-dependent enzyme [bacterium]
MTNPVYLDNAATTWPKPEMVYQSMDEFFRKYAANPGRASHRMAIESERIVEGTRHTLARFFNLRDYKRLIFTLNCTDALNIAIKGVVRQGDHIITSTLEHNSVSRPLARLEQEKFIAVSRVKPDDEGFIHPEEIEKQITQKTRLVVMLHASNVLGNIQDIGSVGALCRKKNLLFLVDAAQTAGVISIDMEKDQVDLLAFPGHKSLFGPPGTGGLCIGERAGELAYWREGGTGSDSTSLVQPEGYPQRLEGGTVNFVGIAGLNAGINFIIKEGPDNIRNHEIELTALLLQGLAKNKNITVYGTDNPKKRVSLASFNLKDTKWDPASLGSMLDQSRGILVRTGHHCAGSALEGMIDSSKETIRVSPGYFNRIEDISFCIDSIHELMVS